MGEQHHEQEWPIIEYYGSVASKGHFSQNWSSQEGTQGRQRAHGLGKAKISTLMQLEMDSAEEHHNMCKYGVKSAQTVHPRDFSNWALVVHGVLKNSNSAEATPASQDNAACSTDAGRRDAGVCKNVMLCRGACHAKPTSREPGRSLYGTLCIKKE